MVLCRRGLSGADSNPQMADMPHAVTWLSGHVAAMYAPRAPSVTKKISKEGSFMTDNENSRADVGEVFDLSDTPNEFVSALEEFSDEGFTENGDLTFTSTGSAALDFFAAAGALRHSEEKEIIDRFERAYAENADIAMKTLFYARDIRGGLGERRLFRVIYAWLMKKHRESAVKNLPYIAEFGRYDDLTTLLPHDEKIIGEIIKKQLDDDLSNMAAEKSVSLLAKWLPSVNASSRLTRKLAFMTARVLAMSPRQYRQTLSKLRQYIDVLENRLRQRDYTFDYSVQPGRAMMKYRAAFSRNDGERYEAFLEAVQRGETKLNAATIFPYEIVERLLPDSAYFWEPDIDNREFPEDELRSLETMWCALPDFTRGEKALTVVDGSGSMYSSRAPSPIAVALSLGLYYAERNTGDFGGFFITFSEHPQLVKVTGSNLHERVMNAAKYNEAANTNLAAVFDLIINRATRHKVSKEDMPAKIYVISDMEFDRCAEDADITTFRRAKEEFEAAGYDLPQIVFWNVESRHRTMPVRKNEQGVVLVSGFSPRIFSMVTDDNLNPLDYMRTVLSSERLKPIRA